jgi:tyrosyl-tRNA synthetase
MYQFWLNTLDADVIDRLKIFTFLTKAEIDDYARQVADEPFRRAAQRRPFTRVVCFFFLHQSRAPPPRFPHPPFGQQHA